jgi:hypothetical protein
MVEIDTGINHAYDNTFSSAEAPRFGGVDINIHDSALLSVVV